MKTTTNLDALATVEAEVLAPLRERIRNVHRFASDPRNIRQAKMDQRDEQFLSADGARLGGLMYGWDSSALELLLDHTLSAAACLQDVRKAVRRGDILTATRDAAALGELVAKCEYLKEHGSLIRYNEQSRTAARNRQKQIEDAKRLGKGWGVLQLSPQQVEARLLAHHQDPEHQGDSYHKACGMLADELGVAVNTVKDAVAKARGDGRRMWKVPTAKRPDVQ